MRKNILRLSIYLLLSFCCIIFGYLISETEFDDRVKQRLDRFLIANTKIAKEHKLLSIKSTANTIELLIEDKNITKLNNQRKLALELGNKYRYDKRNTKYVKGRLVYNNDTIKIKLRLKGLQKDHYIDPLKCSYKIKLRGNNTFLGMKRFSIQHPFTRGYLNEWYFHKLLEYTDLIHLRYNYINVYINGRNSGIYAIEENMHKNLIENNKLKEGPIFRFIIQGEGPIFYHSIEAYNTKRINSDSTLYKQFKQAETLLSQFRKGNIKTQEVFDLTKIAKLFALFEFLGHHHASNPFNLKFYLNPVTGLIEPVAYDNQFINPIEQEGLLGELKAVEIPIKNRGNIRYKNEPFSERLFNDECFFKMYIKYIQEYSNSKWLSNFFKINAKEAQIQKQIIWKSYPEYVFDKKDVLINNQLKLNKILNTYIAPEIKNNEVICSNNTSYLYIRNKNKLPIEITSIYINDLIVFNDTILLQSYFLNELENYTQIELDSNFQTNSNVSINYRYLGMNTCSTSTYKCINTLISNSEIFEKPIIINYSKLDEYDYISVSDSIIEFKLGNHIIDNDLIIPKGYLIKINSGTNLNFIKNSKIISQSPFYVKGSINDSIVFNSESMNGEGLFIFNTDKKSQFSFVSFNNLSNLKYKTWKLSGCVNFYHADVTFDNCLFNSNKRGDDFINIMNSEMKIINSEFNNILSDAFDGDFALGKILNCKFNNIGNDAIDISGSNISVDSCKIIGAKDKAISAGENSNIILNSLVIDRCEIAINAKDKSVVKGKNIKILNSNVALCAFQKKSQFGPSHIIIEDYTCEKTNIKYLIEKGSYVQINKTKYLGDLDKVKNILYGNMYGVKTEK